MFVLMSLADFALSFFASILSSIIFLIAVLHFLRPRLEISPWICQTDETYYVMMKNQEEIELTLREAEFHRNKGTQVDEKHRLKYSFKIVNKSIYNAFDISIELFQMSPVNHIGAHSNLKSHKLKVRTSNMTYISRYRKKFQKEDPFATFARIVHTNEDLEKLIIGQSYSTLRITARHGLTGLAKTSVQFFNDPDVIKKCHKFEFGPKLATIPEGRAI